MTHEASEAARRIAAEVLAIIDLDQRAKDPTRAVLLPCCLIQAALVAAYEAGKEKGDAEGYQDGYSQGYEAGSDEDDDWGEEGDL